MQLAGLLDEDLRRPGAPGQGRSFTQKLGQAAGVGERWNVAGARTRSWRLPDLVPFRGELVGLSAMSQVMFGKYPEGSTRANRHWRWRWCARQCQSRAGGKPRLRHPARDALPRVPMAWKASRNWRCCAPGRGAARRGSHAV
ncbi:hypothetical protein AU476_40955, partial [Cupriavidus sp. UYMSc13B]